jgi:hypothetical protein
MGVTIRFFRILATVALLILVLALVMPWLTINFLSQFNVSLMDIYRYMFQGGQSQPATGSPQQAVNQYLSSVWALFASILLYPFILILAIVSIFSRKACIVTGFLGVFDGVLWVFGIDSLKAEIVKEAIRQGGVFGQLIAGAVTSTITVGYGAYVTILGGIILIIAYFSEMIERKEKPIVQTEATSLKSGLYKRNLIIVVAIIFLLLFSFLPIIPVEEQVIVGYHNEVYPSKFEAVRGYLEDLLEGGTIVGARFHVIMRNLDDRDISVNVEYTPTYSNGWPVQYVLQGYTIKKGMTADLYYDFVVGKQAISLFGRMTGANYRVLDGSPLVKMVPDTKKVTRFCNLIEVVAKFLHLS